MRYASPVRGNRIEGLDRTCIHSFDVAKNAVIATAIRCPKRSGSVLPYVDYAELYGDSEMGTAVVLTKEEWQHLNESAPAPLCWHDF